MSGGDHGAAAPATAARLVRMLQFGDSMFPIGGFAFSGGLESAVQQRVVTDAATLFAFARTAVEQAAMGDGIAVVWAHRAGAAGDVEELVADRRAGVCPQALERDADDVGAHGQEVRRDGRGGDRRGAPRGVV